MEDFRLQKRVKELENLVDIHEKSLHTLRQQQADMLEQIKRLEEMNNDGSGK